VDELWRAVSAGRPTAGPITTFDAQFFATRIAAEVRDYRLEDFVENRKTRRLLSRGDGHCMAAVHLAINDAGWEKNDIDPARAGVFLGCTKETCRPERFYDAIGASLDPEGRVDSQRFGEEAMLQLYPLFVIEALPNACLHYVAETYNLMGANAQHMTTGTAGAQAIGDAFRAIRYGECDYAVAGGFDSYLEWFPFSWLDGLTVMTTRNEEPDRAYRPFDRTRDGFVVGEGAGIVVLEEMGHALARGVPIHAEIVGYGFSADAYQLLKPRTDGTGVATALHRALDDAGLAPSNVSYINAYGSGTSLGDVSETRGIKAALGEHAYRIPTSSTKPVTGHLVGASGAVELIITTLAVKNGCIPPTPNYTEPDPTCDLDYVPNVAREACVETGLSINRGMSGQNSVLIVRQFQE
jgi:3-oxoacyl-[acyl-carrier-protein] synthase II